MIFMKVLNGILSYSDVLLRAGSCVQCVLLLRHSMRRSLQEGSLDPDLTPEGKCYALDCGHLLSGLGDATLFGASPRLRCRETAQCLIRGGDFACREEEIRTFPEIGDDAMFVSYEAMEQALTTAPVGELLKQYYSTGKAPDMIPLQEFSAKLLSFLTQTDFGKRNALLITHDIIIVSLLFSYKVYAFEQQDWMGYIQGAALFRDAEGEWSLGYVVPEASTRKTNVLFV